MTRFAGHLNFKVVIRVDILTNFSFFNVIGRPLEVPKMFYARFVGHKQTKVFVYSVWKVKPQLKSYRRRVAGSTRDQ